jgi:hypothetical protein
VYLAYLWGDCLGALIIGEKKKKPLERTMLEYPGIGTLINSGDCLKVPGE